MQSPPEPPTILRQPFPTLGYIGDVEMTPLDGLRFDRTDRVGAAVLMLIAAGIPSGSSQNQVFAERRFADTWREVTRRYRTPPSRGLRLAAAIDKTLKKLPPPTKDDPNVKYRP